MLCPACGNQLVALNVQSLVVDVCRGGCGGMWFDNFELSRVDEPWEQLGEELVLMPFNPSAVIVRDKRPCPKCAGIVMHQHRFRPDKPVLIDECPACGGVWLDGGELSDIRRPAPTIEDRKKAAQRFFDRLFIEELAELKARRARQAPLT